MSIIEMNVEINDRKLNILTNALKVYLVRIGELYNKPIFTTCKLIFNENEILDDSFKVTFRTTEEERWSVYAPVIQGTPDLTKVGLISPNGEINISKSALTSPLLTPVANYCAVAIIRHMWNECHLISDDV